MYQHYNCGHEGWPYNLPIPPYPSHLRAFIYAALQAEANESDKRSRFMHKQQESTRHPKSRISR